MSGRGKGIAVEIGRNARRKRIRKGKLADE